MAGITASQRTRKERLVEHAEAWAQRLSRLAVLFMRGFSAHWLALANTAALLYVGIPSLAPVLMWLGYERAGRLVYTLFSPLCHQLPERSFFLFGRQWVYSYDALVSALGQLPARYIGDRTFGYKVAVCQRDVAIYASMFLTGLLFGLFRRRFMPLPGKLFFALIAPMAVDGTGQLLGLWTSSWTSRLVTGGSFGAAVVLLAYPHLERGMIEVRRSIEDVVSSWRK